MLGMESSKISRKLTTKFRYPRWLLSRSVDLTYLLCTLHSKREFLLRIFSQPSAAHYLLLICRRIIIIKKAIAGEIHRAGNEPPHASALRLGTRVVTTVGPEAEWQKAELCWEPSKRGKGFTTLEHQAGWGGQCFWLPGHQFCQHFFQNMLGSGENN